jgi:hypothetical protein
MKSTRSSSTDIIDVVNSFDSFKYFKKGSCHLLHPSLKILDEHDGCKLLYEVNKKFLYVSYDDDKRAILTCNINTVIDILNKHYGEVK